MKTLRRILLAALILLLALTVLPFLIPINNDGVDPAQLATDPEGAFVTLQGVRVYYEDHGDPDNPAVILVHGLFGSTGSWRYNIDALAGAGLRVVVFDRPGFGLSDKRESFDYSVANQADLTAELMDTLGIDRAVIVGHSAGGNVAAHFALRHPDRVEKLVLADAAVISGGPPAFVGGIVALPPVWRWGRIGLRAAFSRGVLENNLRGFYVDPTFLTETDFDVYWRAFQTKDWEIGLLGLTRDAAGNQLREPEIRQITAQTLILWGEQDMTTPLSQGEQLDTWIPDSVLTVIPDTGHQPFEEDPQAFNAAVIAFIAP